LNLAHHKEVEAVDVQNTRRQKSHPAKRRRKAALTESDLSDVSSGASDDDVDNVKTGPQLYINENDDVPPQLFDASDSADDVDDIQSAESDSDEDVSRDKLKAGDYVVIKLRVGKNVFHYAARIEDMGCGEQKIEVMCLPKKKMVASGPEQFISSQE
jgi:hypothetical protein